SAIGIPLLGLLLFYFGWRWTFAATGFISLLYFALFYGYYRNPSEDKLLKASERDFIARGGRSRRIAREPPRERLWPICWGNVRCGACAWASRRITILFIFC